MLRFFSALLCLMLVLGLCFADTALVNHNLVESDVADMKTLCTLCLPGIADCDGTCEKVFTMRSSGNTHKVHPMRTPQALRDENTLVNIPVHITEQDGVISVVDTPYLMLEATDVAEHLLQNAVGEGAFALHVGGSQVQLFASAHARSVAATHTLRAWGESVEELQAGECTDSTSTVGENLKWLVYRITFSDNAASPVDWNDATITDEFMSEVMTEIEESLDIQSFGVYTLAPGTSVLTANVQVSTTWADFIADGSCDWNSVQDEAREIVFDTMGLNHCDFAIDMTLTSYSSSCPYAGQAWVGSRGGHLNGFLTTGVFLHEVGHNLGINHANSWLNYGSPEHALDEGGTMAEYGDSWDIMGNANTAAKGVFTVQTRSEVLGWLAPEAIREVGLLDEDFILYPCDAAGVGSDEIVALKWTRNRATDVQLLVGGVSYDYSYDKHWFSYRGAAWDDVYTPNGLLHRVELGGYSLLIDHEYTTSSISDAPLIIGNTFSDCMFGYHITAVQTLECPNNPELTCMQVAVRYGVTNNTIEASFTPATGRATVGTPFTVTGSTVSTTDAVVSLNWLVDDGTEYANMDSMTHTFETPGVRIVTVTATDFAGAVHQVEYPVVVDGDGFALAVDQLISTPTYIDAVQGPITSAYGSLPNAPEGYTITTSATFDAQAQPRWIVGRGGSSSSVGLIATLTSELSTHWEFVFNTTFGDAHYENHRGVDVAVSDIEDLHIALVVLPTSIQLYIDGDHISAADFYLDENDTLSETTNSLTVGYSGEDFAPVQVTSTQLPERSGAYFHCGTHFGAPAYCRKDGSSFLYQFDATRWFVSYNLGVSFGYLVGTIVDPDNASPIDGLDLTDKVTWTAYVSGYVEDTVTATEYASYMHATVDKFDYYSFALSQTDIILDMNNSFDISDQNINVILTESLDCIGEQSCADFLHNGDETAPDCGGDTCGACACDVLLVSGLGSDSDNVMGTYLRSLDATKYNNRNYYQHVDGTNRYLFNNADGWVLGNTLGGTHNFVVASNNFAFNLEEISSESWSADDFSIRCYACDEVQLTVPSSSYPLSSTPSVWTRNNTLYNGEFQYQYGDFTFHYQSGNNWYVSPSSNINSYYLYLRLEDEFEGAHSLERFSSDAVTTVWSADDLVAECVPCQMLSLYSSQGLNEMAGLWTISNYYDGFPSYVHNSLDLFLFFDAATWAWKVSDTLGGVNAFAYLPMTNLGYIPLGSEAAEFFPWRVVSEVNSLTWVTDATMTATCLNETLFVDPCYIMSCGEDTDTCLDPSNNCTYCSDSDFGGNHCSPGGNGCSGIASAASCPLVALESLALCDSFCGTYFTECLLNEDSTSATCTCSDGFLGDDCSTYPVYANVAADDTTSTDPDTLVGEGGGEDDLTVVWIIVGVVVGFILIGIIVAAVLKKRQSNSAQSTHTRHISTNVPMTSVAAAAPAPAPVKSNWEKHMDPASGQPYWFNTVTQESSWEYRN